MRRSMTSIRAWWSGEGRGCPLTGIPCFSSRQRDNINLRASRILFGKESVGNKLGVTFKHNAVCDKRAALCAVCFAP